jgi:quinoprotein glucose dehydrogenase
MGKEPRHGRVTVFALLLPLFVLSFSSARKGSVLPENIAGEEWPYYGHDAGGMRYSPLTQINRENVSTLKVAWTFHTGDISEGRSDRKRSGFETTPLLVDGTLYLTTAFNRVIALDPETGTQCWAYDPRIELDGDYGDGLVNRGAATWLDFCTLKRSAVPKEDFRVHARCAARGPRCGERFTLRGLWQKWPG